MRATLLLIFAAFFFALPFAAQAAQINDECELPQPLVTAIERQWHSWKVLHIADLTAEDQNLWTYSRGRVCPGAARGHFLEAQTISYAVALVRGRQQAVIVAREHQSNWLLSTVLAPTMKHRFRVLWRAKPGSYIDKLTARKSETTLDPIGFEEIGGDVTLLIRQQNRFIQLHTAQ